MKNYKSIFVFSLTIFMFTGCTSQQLGQAIYDSARTTECSKTTGDPYCNPNSNPNER